MGFVHPKQAQIIFQKHSIDTTRPTNALYLLVSDPIYILPTFTNFFSIFVWFGFAFAVFVHPELIQNTQKTTYCTTHNGSTHLYNWPMCWSGVELKIPMRWSGVELKIPMLWSGVELKIPMRWSGVELKIRVCHRNERQNRDASRTTKFAPGKSLWFFKIFLELSLFNFCFTVFFSVVLWSGLMKGIMKGYNRLSPIMKGYERCSKMLRIWRKNLLKRV